jgi:hypothetical protein
MAAGLSPVTVTVWVHAGSQTAGHSDPLQTKYHHSHTTHPSEGAPLLRQAAVQLIVAEEPKETGSDTSVQRDHISTRVTSDWAISSGSEYSVALDDPIHCLRVTITHM